MSTKSLNALVLCTGNSARSILCEALLNRFGEGKIRAYSAGSQPKKETNPFALKLLQGRGYDTGFARSKSWDEFVGRDAPEMDLIFTVCANAAAEACLVWPGHPATVHWGIPDPAAATGSDEDIMAAFETAYEQLEVRVTAFLNLPLDELEMPELVNELRRIGETAS